MGEKQNILVSNFIILYVLVSFLLVWKETKVFLNFHSYVNAIYDELILMMMNGNWARSVHILAIGATLETSGLKLNAMQVPKWVTYMIIALHYHCTVWVLLFYFLVLLTSPKLLIGYYLWKLITQPQQKIKKIIIIIIS